MNAARGTRAPGDLSRTVSNPTDLYTPSDASIIASVGNSHTKGARFQLRLRQFIDMHSTTPEHNLYRWRLRAVHLLQRRGAPARHISDHDHAELVNAYNAVLMRISEAVMADASTRLAAYFAEDFLDLMNPATPQGAFVTDETRSAMCVTAAAA